MLETHISTTFFLKTSKKSDDERFIYLRISINGIPKETSTKKKWAATRWNQKKERALGTKEDARTINAYLDDQIKKVEKLATVIEDKGIPLTSQILMDSYTGNNLISTKVLDEFAKHNEELFALIPSGEVAEGTHTRYVTARSHVSDFIRFKYKCADLEFKQLNFEFVKEYELYLKTVRGCNHNTTLKYIANFKKIVLRGVAKDYIPKDPFMMFKSKKTKPNKKPLSREELSVLESKNFTTKRLEVIRDIFVFQCYTGLAYSDVYKLDKANIVKGIDGELWIMDSRKKSKSEFNVPLLPKALEIINKYKDDPDCISTGRALPVKSNQKMNEYLKEIAAICEISSILNTHKARRTFGSTVTLANGVPIHVVKDMLGHQSVKQTEEYALTEQEAISKEMQTLRRKLSKKENNSRSIIEKNTTSSLKKLDIDRPLTNDELNLVAQFIESLRTKSAD
ncbi:site-specific integrase [Sphingobacterium bambusae]|uniref:Site-specific integrase n=1 Tax=Sphingobacterium bambusae TaxID=662858 RepID=A0ABW6BJJ3_9SPHI|nr:site-specific integrase [Sphingobacterium bambusae]WPL49356.1 site-specific integrase [Sphingobacterium bambusae]